MIKIPGGLDLNKKNYIIDNGIRNVVSFQFSQDKGKFLENLIFIELKRRGETVYFYKGKGECDFLIEKKGKIDLAIQVTFDISLENQKLSNYYLEDINFLGNIPKGQIKPTFVASFKIGWE